MSAALSPCLRAWGVSNFCLIIDVAGEVDNYKCPGDAVWRAVRRGGILKCHQHHSIEIVACISRMSHGGEQRIRWHRRNRR